MRLEVEDYALVTILGSLVLAVLGLFTEHPQTFLVGVGTLAVSLVILLIATLSR